MTDQHRPRRDATEAPVAMVLGDTADDGHPPPPDPTPTRRRRRIAAVVALVVVAVLAGMVLLGRLTGPPLVRATDDVSGTVRAVPEAPRGPVVQRWSRRLPNDQELVGVAVLGDTVVVASEPRFPDRAGGSMTVTGHATTDGTQRWRRLLDEANPRVALATDDRVEVLSLDRTRSMTLVGGAVQASQWQRGHLVALDPGDGSRRWTTGLTANALVRARADRGSLVIHRQDGVREIDARTGDVRFDFPRTSDVPSDLPDVASRRATLSGDTWVVPTDRGWDLLGPDGDVDQSVESSVVPHVTSDWAVTAEGRTVTAHRRPTGERTWTVRLDQPVEFLGPARGWAGGPAPASAALGTEPGPDDLLVVVLAGLAEATGDPPPATGITAAGDPVDLGDVTRVVTRTWLQVGDRRLGLCVTVPERMRPDGAACPHQAALFDAGGDVIASRDDLDLFPSTPGRVDITQAGVVVVQRTGLSLHGWNDLSTVWEIPNDGRGPVPADVQTTSTGVAVAWDQPVPASVSWYG